MSVELFKTQKGKLHSANLTLSETRKIRFTENSKGTVPKWSVKLSLNGQEYCSLGSVSRGQIDITFRALKRLDEGYSDDFNFIARAKSIIGGNFIIDCMGNERLFYRLLTVGFDEFF